MAKTPATRGVQLDFLQDDGRVELIEILESLRGKKCLVLDTPIGGLLNHIIPEGSKLLKDNGVQYFRELRGVLGDFTSNDTANGSGGLSMPDHIVYLTRPTISNMKLIAKQIHGCIKSGLRSQFQYHVYFIPHRSVACEQMLEDEGVLDIVNIGEYHLGLIPFDSDIVSLEIGDLYKQCYVDNDLSSLDTIARSLYKLQSIYGLIPNIKSKGSSSKKVLQRLLRICRENHNDSDDNGNGGGGAGAGVGSGGAFGGGSSGLGGLGGGDAGAGEGVDTMILLDREVDLFSCLLTPLTYEGLIDECVGIENGRVKLDASVLGDEKDSPPPLQMPSSGGNTQQQQVIAAAIASSAADGGDNKKYLPGDKVALSLNNTDNVFKECRDLSIESLGTYLQEKAIMIRKKYSDFRDNKDASISEIHGFVKKIPELTKEYKSLNQHINIAELLKVTTDSPQFRANWQTERGMLEGEPALLDYVEDLIVEDCTERTNFFKILRLFCLSSLTSNGIQAKKFDHLRKLIVHTYGYEHLFTLMNLEKAGLLRRKENILLDTSSTASSPLWVALRTQLRLINENVNMSSPDDIAYVTAGFAPILARVVQALGGPNWGSGSFTETLKLLPGPFLEFTQLQGAPFEELNDVLARSKQASVSRDQAAAGASGPDGDSLNSGAPNAASLVHFFSDSDELSGRRKKTLLVFFVGGVSYVEIAALRFLSNDPLYPYNIIIGTTSIGNTMLKSLVHNGI